MPSALEMLADSQTRLADLAGRGKGRLVCVQHGEVKDNHEIVENFYSKCMPWLERQEGANARQAQESYRATRARTQSDMARLAKMVEPFCSDRGSCEGETQERMDSISYQVDLAEQSRREGNTLLACTTYKYAVEGRTRALEDAPEGCDVSTTLAEVERLRIALPDCCKMGPQYPNC